MTCQKKPMELREAQQVIRRFAKSGKLRKPVRYYWCEEHRTYHVTSKPEWKPGNG